MHYYEQLLGEEYHRIHPLLQQRYGERMGQTVHVTGTMQVVENGCRLLTPVLALAQPTKFMFADEGYQIPFELTTCSRLQSNGLIAVLWQRTFYFQRGPRYYNTIMVIDPIKKQAIDYNGKHRLLGSVMDIRVTQQGGIWMQSQRQFIQLGRQKIWLPSPLRAQGIALETVNASTNELEISVFVWNRNLGGIKRYKGTYNNVNVM